MSETDDGKQFDNSGEAYLECEITYGHCSAENPYWFIPDLECNTDDELLSWRHAITALDQGAFESPEHFYWKENNGVIIHGHNTPWGMGISTFSDKYDLWGRFPEYRWLLDMAKSGVSDKQYLQRIKYELRLRKR